MVDATIDYKVSSGLADQGIRDWYEHAQETMASDDPDAVVFIIGTNDASIVEHLRRERRRRARLGEPTTARRSTA